MTDLPVISVENVSKAYRIWASPAQRLLSPLGTELANLLPAALGDPLRQRARAGYKDFFALENVGFEVRRGEAVGVIGRNGAGKSTLLQIIAGTLQPTSGTAKIHGRVAALLELGAGFNPEFTGRENVFLSGAVLGLSQAEIGARFAEIAAFADIGDFIDQPVKTYSSGMQMRLAFAVNTCVDPDILIVDEALSVGDAPFQAKCFRRLRQLIDKGVSLLFVSHDIGTIRSICSRALWLKNGRAEMWGEAKQIAREYEKFCWQEQGVEGVAPPLLPAPNSTADLLADPAPNMPTARIAVPAVLWQPNLQFAKLSSADRWGNGAVSIENVVMLQPDGSPASAFDYDSAADAWLMIRLATNVSSDFMIGFRLNTLKGEPVLAIQDLNQTLRLEGRAGDVFALKTRMRLPLHHSDYSLRVAIFGYKDGKLKRGPAYDFGDAVVWDVIESCAILTVRPYVQFPLSGPVHLHGTTEVIKAEAV